MLAASADTSSGACTSSGAPQQVDVGEPVTRPTSELLSVPVSASFQPLSSLLLNPPFRAVLWRSRPTYVPRAMWEVGSALSLPPSCTSRARS